MGKWGVPFPELVAEPIRAKSMSFVSTHEYLVGMEVLLIGGLLRFFSMSSYLEIPLLRDQGIETPYLM